MQKISIQKILFGVIVIAGGVFLYYIFSTNKNNNLPNTNSNLTSTTTSNNPGYTIEKVPIENNIPKPIPDLNRSITVYSGAVVNAEVRALTEPKIKSLQATLKSNPGNISQWIELGIYQKNVGDYIGAIESWKYAGMLSPKDYVSVSNLGNIYAYYIKDSKKAEEYYLQAIKLDTMQAYLYIQLAEVYRDVFADLTKARSIIDEGLKKVPNDGTLLQFKSSLN